MRHILLTPLLAALLAGPAAAADLEKVGRAIKKEPAYKGKPAYLLLAFGERAQDLVWLVHDGDVLYVDRNGDGDLTGQGEKVAKKADDRPDGRRTFEVGEVRVGGRRHKGLTVTISPLKEYADSSAVRNFKPFQDALKADPDGRLAAVTLDVDHPRLKGGGIDGRVSVMAGPLDLAGLLRFAATAKGAPVIRPDGPLEVTLGGPAQPALTLGRSSDLVLVVAAKGHGPGARAEVFYDDTIPRSANPKVEVTWPGAKPADKPVKELYELKERC